MEKVRVVFSGVADQFNEQLNALFLAVGITSAKVDSDAGFQILQIGKDAAQLLLRALSQNEAVEFRTACFPGRATPDGRQKVVLGPLYFLEQRRIEEGPRLWATPAEILRKT